MKIKRAFTLIELLIVVAIIAILAAIAVPNFLEAQVRSKVSRTKADMRSMATALEAYAVDHNVYPNCHAFGIATRNYVSGNPSDPLILERLSTPIAYITNTVVKDPFLLKGRIGPANACSLASATVIPVSPGTDTAAALNSYIYQAWNQFGRYTLPPDSFSTGLQDRSARAWLLHSAGPDSVYHNLGGILANNGPADVGCTINLIYDPTNGTVSFGSIYRMGGMAQASGGSGSYQAGSGLFLAVQTQK
ncbi:MAG: hypothetical protein Kow0059_04910 [Candidatus Sumerlaeia bacterium]